MFKAYFAIEKKIAVQHPHAGLANADEKDEFRKSVIDQFTGGRKNSLKALSATEYREFIKWLPTAFKLTTEDWKNSPENNMRLKVIVLLKKQGYKLPNGKADMPRINAWAKTHTAAKAELNSQTVPQLIATINQVQIMYTKYINHA